MDQAQRLKSPLPFEFTELGQLLGEIERLGISIPLERDFNESAEILGRPCRLGNRVIPNSLSIQPMEGCDGEEDGRPGSLTVRRYIRFARGGAGLIWVEATAVVPEGRANPRQLWINEKSLSSFRQLAETIRESGRNHSGAKQDPYIVLQLTHSGRYSKPRGFPMPIISYHSPVLKHQENEHTRIITDAELDELKGKYVAAAQMAEECGFDAVDIKCCHGYLLHELLSGYTRKESRYGGIFENRTRFLVETAIAVRKALSSAEITSRLNIYDGIPHPYGWGMKKDGSLEPGMEEPILLVEKLRDAGMNMVNLAVGNPYYQPHVERPYDYPVDGGYLPGEHPLETISRIIDLTCRISERFPSLFIINTGFSWLRHFAPLVGAELKKKGKITSFGLGRLALAYPGFANALLGEKRLEPEKMCITCSSCSQIMRDGGRAGCVVRDGEIYAPVYREGRSNSQDYLGQASSGCLQCWEGACRAGCPAGVDIRGFIGAFRKGDSRLSYRLLRRRNPLPEITSYVCPVETLCEKNCLSGTWQSAPVPVHRIQRKVSEIAAKNNWTAVIPGTGKEETVAVVGGGPAGIAASVFLVEMGYKVVIFEAGRKLGGMLNIIPARRLPPSVTEREISGLELEKSGRIRVEYGKRLFVDFTPEDLFRKKFAAILLATGLEESASLPLEKPDGVIPALDFFRDKAGFLSGRERTAAAVVGGGNLAMDAATALREEGWETYLLYRRGRKEMPAWPAEAKAAEDSGVHFMILSQPVEYIRDMNGRLSYVRIIHTRLGDPDGYGRRKPEEIPGTGHMLPVKVCVEAVGQNLCASLKKHFKCDNGKILTAGGCHLTDNPGIFAAGDALNGGDTVAGAIAGGREAAFEIDRFLGRGGLHN